MLSERDAAVLALEARAWHFVGAKESAARNELGLSPTRYAQVLNALLDDPDAYAAQPMLVKRLRRLRDSRRVRH